MISLCDGDKVSARLEMVTIIFYQFLKSLISSPAFHLEQYNWAGQKYCSPLDRAREGGTLYFLLRLRVGQTEEESNIHW